MFQDLMTVENVPISGSYPVHPLYNIWESYEIYVENSTLVKDYGCCDTLVKYCGSTI